MADLIGLRVGSVRTTERPAAIDSASVAIAATTLRPADAGRECVEVRYGEVGDVTQTQRTVPVRIGTGSWSSVSTGDAIEAHTCAIRADTSLWCWGFASGQSGGGRKTANASDTTVPTRVGSDVGWEVVDAGVHATCGVRTGRAYCWGSGELGNGSTASTGPVEVQGGFTDWIDLEVAGGVSSMHVCGIRSTGTLWCWGLNADGQLGAGDTVTRSVPTQVGTATTWAGLAADPTQTSRCAVRTDRTQWCWGSNASGQWGTGSTSGSATPVQVRTGVTDLAMSTTALLLPWPG